MKLYLSLHLKKKMYKQSIAVASPFNLTDKEKEKVSLGYKQVHICYLSKKKKGKGVFKKIL